MHSVGRIDWSFAASPPPETATARGLARSVMVDSSRGAVHLELAAAAFAPGGWLATHVHAYEEAFRVLAGEMTIEIDGRCWRLQAGDFALLPVGTSHTVANLGTEEARWIAVNTPQRFGPDDERRDTYFDVSRFDLERLRASAVRPEADDPTVHLAGRGSTSSGAAGSGIVGRPLVDRAFGADLLTMLAVESGAGGAEKPRDHPFEEAYVILEGTVEAQLDGTSYELHPGDTVFAGVRTLHAFRNAGSGTARWIMAQAPQPPLRHASRFPHLWEAFAAADPR